MDYTIVRFLSSSAVRAFCIQYNLYTLGSNEDYEQMLANCSEAVNDRGVQAIAEDIWRHSDFESNTTAGSIEDILELIWMLAATCTEVRVQPKERQFRKEG